MLIAAFGFLLGAQAQTDLALTSIDTMSSGCGLTTQIVRVNFSNVGSTVINSPAVSYRVNGGAAVNGTISGAIPVGGTGSFNFPAAYVFPSTGTFVFEAWVRATGDNNTLNDTAFRTVVNLSSKTGGDTLRFDTNPSLATGGTNNSWAHGAPSGPVISTAPSSPNIWVTNLSGDYNSNEDSWIQTGCYDLSGLSQPMVRFDLNYRTENSFDGGILEASTDGGSTWATVGAQGSGSNWYNGSLTRTYYTGPIWMNNSNGWVRAQHNLSGLTSLTQVIFRFHFYSDGSVEEDGVGIDNFEIYDSASLLQPNDVGVAYFEKPISGCGLSASDTVVVWVQNFGTSNQSNVSVAYSMNGGAPVNATIPGIIPAGTSVRYAFATRVNVSAGGSYNFVGYTSLANDLLRFNDTARATVVNNTVSSFPYLENFESGTSGGGFAQGTFPNGWSVTTKNSGFPFSWYLFSGSTGSFATGPTVDHTFGTAAGKYTYTEASSGIQDDTTILTTPCFNLTSLTNPTLEFWFHRVGASIGTMVVEYDDNGTWTYLDSLAGQFQTAETDPWQRRTATLPASLNNTKLRFIGIRGVGFDGDMAIDDVRVFDSLLLNNDVGISAVLKPTGSGCGAVTDSVVVTVYNFGLTAQSNIPVSYVFNGGAPVNAIVAGSIPAQSSRRYAFSTLVTATSGSTNTVVAYTTLTNDGQRVNDTARGTFTRLYSITGADTQTFDPRPSLWTIGGANTTWAEGAPTASVQNSPVSAPNVIATNLSGDYNSNEDSWIQTSCYNLAGMTQPMVKFDLNYETENNYDGVILESSTDGGATWATVGAQGSGTNWYNGALTRTYYTGPIWMNSSGGWVNVEHSLSGITNLSNVIFRFHFFSDGSVVRNGINIDNFSVYDSAILNQPNDVGISRIVKPITGCGLSAADSVVVLVRNSGTSAQSNVSVGYIFNGGAPVLGTVPGTLAPGAIVRYAFTSTVNVATGGNYSLVAFTRLATDQLRFNDTLRATITNSIINTFPHFQDFETSVSGNGTTIGTLPAGWNVDNSGRTGFTFSWMALSGSTSSFATGPTVDNTTGTAAGKYVYTETSYGAQNDSSYLYTPCMNMSALNRPAMSFWYHKVGATMGDMIIEYDNNGTWTLLDTILGQTHANETDPWLQKNIVFPGRVTNTKIRFIGVRGSSFTGDMAIDDVRFFDSSGVALRRDASIVRVLSPTAGTKGTSIRPSVTVKNTGTATLNVFDINMSVNGVVALTQSFAGNLLPNDSVTFTFNNSYNYTSSGSKTICVYSSLANDVNRANDTSCITHLSSLSNQDLTSGVFVYPNPAKNLVTLEMGTAYKNGTLELINALGQVERRRILDGNTKQILSLEGLAEGIYIYTIQLDGKVFQGKLMIQK